MVVRELEAFLKERRLIKSENLSVLRGARIGIEASHWLRKLNFPTEPFQVAMGGVPLLMAATVTQQLEKFKAAGIEPFFVFNGLSTPRKERISGSILNENVQKRNRAWAHYERGEHSEAAKSFLTASNFANSPDGANYLIRIFRERKVDFMRAPYQACAQLSWLNNNNLVHTVYGSSELLLFNTQRIIFSINFETNLFEYVDRNEMLTSLQMSHHQFVDACLLAGNSFIATFPVLADMARAFSFNMAYESVMNAPSGYAAVQSYVHHHPQLMNSDYSEQFLKARALVNHHVIFKPTTGTCEALNPEFCPADLHLVIGPRFPDDVYAMMCIGLISPQTLNILATGNMLETPPLSDSTEYRELMMDVLMKLRTLSINLTASSLNEFFSGRKLTSTMWHQPNQLSDIARQKIAITDGICWKVDEATIQNQLKSILNTANDGNARASGVGFHVAFGFKALPTKCDLPTGTSNEVYCYTILRTLEYLGYFESLTASTSVTPNIFGRALMSMKATMPTTPIASPSSRNSHQQNAASQIQFAEQAVVLLELLRSNRLSSQKLRRPVLTERAKGEKGTVLLAHVFSLIPMKLRDDEAWGPNIDADLMAFNSVVKAVYRTLRNLSESVLISLYVVKRKTSPAACNIDDFIAAAESLPFAQEANTCMGIAIKAVLDHTPASPNDTLNLREVFPICKDPAADLRTAYLFWKQILQMVHILSETPVTGNAVVSKDLLDQFENADSLLESKKHYFW